MSSNLFFILLNFIIYKLEYYDNEISPKKIYCSDALQIKRSGLTHNEPDLFVQEER